jgi:hypothetical protein
MIRMARLPLKQVTLCAIDTRAPALAMQSLLRSMAGIDFARVLLFTHQWLPQRVVPGIEIIDIGPIHAGADYSQFVLRELPAHVRTSHVLVTQWDGFVANPAAWTDEFLVHDYIGAVWPDAPTGHCVGNGGFSLRSRRLLAAGRDARLTRLHPEDKALCVTYREQLEKVHGVSFAPPALARRFAFENEAPGGPTFGFHGPYNLPRFVSEGDLLQWMQALPDAFFASRDARRLARAALFAGQPRLAQAVVARRRAVGRTEASTAVLGKAAAILGAFTKPAIR